MAEAHLDREEEEEEEEASPWSSIQIKVKFQQLISFFHFILVSASDFRLGERQREKEEDGDEKPEQQQQRKRIGSALHRGCVWEQRKRREMADAEAHPRPLAFSSRRRPPPPPLHPPPPLPLPPRVSTAPISLSFQRLHSIISFHRVCGFSGAEFSNTALKRLMWEATTLWMLSGSRIWEHFATCATWTSPIAIESPLQLFGPLQVSFLSLTLLHSYRITVMYAMFHVIWSQ